MKNDTLRILENLIHQYQTERLAWDPEDRMLKARRQTLMEAFHTAHGDDHALILEVNDLVDAYTLLAEYRNDFTLRLGLQIGLELGGLDILRGI